MEGGFKPRTDNILILLFGCKWLLFLKKTAFY